MIKKYTSYPGLIFFFIKGISILIFYIYLLLESKKE